MTIYLVRHARAGERGAWRQDDWLRPLSRAGRAQARGLLGLLRDAAFDRVLSSPYVRCLETVVPIAGARRLADRTRGCARRGWRSRRGARDRAQAHRERRGALQSRRRDPRGARDLSTATASTSVPDPRCPKGCTWVLEAGGGVDVTRVQLPPAPAGAGRVSEPIDRQHRSTSVDALLDLLAGCAAHADEEDVDLLAHALQCGATSPRRSRPTTSSCRWRGSCTTSAPRSYPTLPIATRASEPTRCARCSARASPAWSPATPRPSATWSRVDASYRDALSARSVVTLAAQGGPLDQRAVEAFARGRDAEALVALRHADDAAKVPGAAVAGLDSWRPVDHGPDPVARQVIPIKVGPVSGRCKQSYSSGNRSRG